MYAASHSVAGNTASRPVTFALPMDRHTKFVDVILPLALPHLLTYRVPFVLNDLVKTGQRVIVQLRDKKLYTALVREVHERVPARYEAKYIDEILDELPVVTPQQLELWDWVARYYCCYPGEVMMAALPSALKLSSDTKIALAEGFSDDSYEWNNREWQLIEALRDGKTLSIKDLPKILGFKTVQSTIKSLVEKKAIHTEEEIREKFKPRKTDFVRIGPLADTEEKLQHIFSDLEKRKAIKQTETLMMFLKLSGWDEGKHGQVERIKLQQASGTNAGVIANMEAKGIFVTWWKEIGRLSTDLFSSETTKPLSAVQQTALHQLQEQWMEKDVVLLHGVTSSGKTEIYAELINHEIKKGKQVLFLLPEIALTTQIINRLRKYFGKEVGVYHSGYSDNERTEVWHKVLSNIPGECDIILGARSALFLPFNRLGLVIVDEEHEHSYKQHDPAPRYHARDLSIVLAKKFNAKVLLGSATPAIESFRNAESGRYGLVQLTERFGGVELPEIFIADIRQDLKSKTMRTNFGELLVREMTEALQREEQIILFQNRRGYSPLWQCHDCGMIPQCVRCDVSLTYHKAGHQLRCHYCGYATDPPRACGACGSTDLRMLGFGTEKVEEDIAALFPEASVQRMDLDTTRSKSSYQKIISDFEDRRVNILVGTQMVTKGLDFDNVSLVGILNADKMMNYPDFRSFERSFQLMMQVAGRAGRKEKRGKVIIQTYSPAHWLLETIVQNDYQALYQREMGERKAHYYPPFTRLMKFTLKHKQDDVVENASLTIGKELRKKFGERIMGPERPMVPRINNYFLRQFLIKLERTNEALDMKTEMVKLVREQLLQSDFKSVRLAVDVDPV